MSTQKINRQIILRYCQFQIPSLLIVTLLIFLIDRWYGLSTMIMIFIIFGWVLKDILLFPFVWRAYSFKDRDKSKMMLYEKGVAIQAINPSGYVRIDGELWHAELVDSNEPILKDDPIEVTEICGLKLKVKRISSNKPINSN